MAEQMPDEFPPLTLSIMRALCALTAIDPRQETLIKALNALFSAYWVHHRMAHKPEILKEILSGVLGQYAAEKGKT